MIELYNSRKKAEATLAEVLRDEPRWVEWLRVVELGTRFAAARMTSRSSLAFASGKIKTMKVAAYIRPDREDRRTRPATGAACDVCDTPLSRGERSRLVWKSGLGDDLVLADLCARCAAESDSLLEMYGGRGRSAMRFTQQGAVSGAEPPVARLQMLGAMMVRGLVYVLIALATFVIITFVTARN